MEGTVQREGDRLRMTVQLVRAGTGEVLWADSYERSQRSLYALQGEIARSVGAAIAVEMTPKETAALAAIREVDPKAYELLLRARFYGKKFTEEAAAKSIEYYKAAIAIQPDYAEAYAGLAGKYLSYPLWIGGMDRERAYELGSAYIDSAMAIDPNSAHAASATRALYYHWNWSEAEAEYAKLIERDPGDAGAWRGLGFLYGVLMGRTEEAVAHCRRAKELNPLGLDHLLDLAAVLGMAGSYEEAEAELNAALELNPTWYPARITQVGLFRDQGRYQESLEAILRMEKEGLLMGGDRPLIGVAYALAGNRGKAEGILQELRDHPPSGEEAKTTLAELYNALDKGQEAVDLLVEAYRDHDSWFPMYLTDRNLANLYQNPRIRAILDELKMSWLVDFY
jgi:tetratricopeptide (TPR) repeat protein